MAPKRKAEKSEDEPANKKQKVEATETTTTAPIVISDDKATPASTSIFNTNKTIAQNLVQIVEQAATTTNFDALFAQVADYLMNQVVLVINGNTTCRLAEIEFYLLCKEHNDPYPHQNEMQLTNSQWYFHRSGNTAASSYRSGTYKGLDITFGKGKDIYGGILIRGILPNGDKLVDGPCKCVDYILQKSGSAAVPDLVAKLTEGLDVEKNTGTFCLKHKTDPLPLLFTSSKVYHSGRVGLTLKKAGKEVERYASFILKPYRYYCVPKLIKKGKQYMICQLLSEGKTEDEVVKETGSTKAAVKKANDSFKKGVAKKSEKDYAKEFVGKSIENDDLCTLAGFLL